MHEIIIPVSEAQRAKSLFGKEPPTPTGYPAPESITYSAQRTGKDSVGPRRAICFSEITYDDEPLSAWNVKVEVALEREGLGHANIFQFLQSLTEYDLVPEGLETEESEGVCKVSIPAHQGHPHLTYMALCAARWCIHQPGLVKDYLRILKEDEQITPYQMLPLLCGRWVRNSNHSPFGNDSSAPAHGTSNPFFYLAAANLGQRPEIFPVRQRTAYEHAGQLLYQTQAQANEDLRVYRERFGEGIRLALNYYILAQPFSEFFQTLHGQGREEVREKFFAFLRTMLNNQAEKA